MNETQSMVLNDDFNEWYESKIQKFVQLNPDIKKRPDKWNSFKFDLTQAKKDAIHITDNTVSFYECPSRLQTTADIHCIGRTTVHDLLKSED